MILSGGPGFAALRASIDDKVLGEVTAERAAYTPWLSAEFPPLRLEGGLRKVVLEILETKDAPGVAPGAGAAADRTVGLVAIQLRPRSRFIDAWSTIGNWPCPKEGGWEKAWDPELNQDLEAVYKVPDGREVRWKEVAGGTVGLGGGDWLVAYGLTQVWSPEARTVALFIGKDDGLKVWANGEVIFDQNTWSHAIPDSFFTTMNLRAGWNKILVKCANWSGGWAFMLRPGDPDHKLRFARKPE